MVLGAGPAGCAAAIPAALAGHRVVILEAEPVRPNRIGENLASAAFRLLDELGISREFLADRHLPCHARVSRWGSSSEESSDALTDLDGPGWLLDRARFDDDLRRAAQDAGAQLVAPARASGRVHLGQHWLVTHTAAAEPIRAAFVIEATGREGRITPVRGQHDRMVCAWVHLPRQRAAPAVTHIVSEPDGWWYTAPVPGDRRVLAFHTDPDIAQSLDLRSTLMARAEGQESLAEVLEDSDLGAPGDVSFCAAGGRPPSALDPGGNLAVGDASMAFDPISGQGIFHALYTGTLAGRAVRDALAGDQDAVQRYGSQLSEIWEIYQSRRHLAYAHEQRWPDHPFWQRRHGSTG